MCMSVSLSVYVSVCLCLSRYVIMELIETEKDYVRDLGLIVEVGPHDTLLVIFLTDNSSSQADTASYVS